MCDVLIQNGIIKPFNEFPQKTTTAFLLFSGYQRTSSNRQAINGIICVLDYFLKYIFFGLTSIWYSFRLVVAQFRILDHPRDKQICPLIHRGQKEARPPKDLRSKQNLAVEHQKQLICFIRQSLEIFISVALEDNNVVSCWCHNFLLFL